MFVIKQSDTYTWPVKVKYAVNEGKYETQEFTAEFKRLPQSKINELADKATAVENREADIDPVDYVQEFIVGWSDLFDEKEKPVLFSKAQLKKVLDIPGVLPAIAFAWRESVVGARRGN